MRVAALVPLAAAALLLTGCSITTSANPTVPATEVAALAETALAGEWNAEPTVDCGDESVDLVVDTAVECTAYNPNSGLDYPATVTISEVDGAKYSIDVAVGQAIVEEQPEADAPTVTPESLEGLASTALADELGYTPVLDCGTEPIAIVLDGRIDCVATGDDGVDYPATVVVTEVTDTGYDIDVAMGAEPLG